MTKLKRRARHLKSKKKPKDDTQDLLKTINHRLLTAIREVECCPERTIELRGLTVCLCNSVLENFEDEETDFPDYNWVND